jgi:hypothetical protein
LAQLASEHVLSDSRFAQPSGKVQAQGRTASSFAANRNPKINAHVASTTRKIALVYL